MNSQEVYEHKLKTSESFNWTHNFLKYEMIFKKYKGI